MVIINSIKNNIEIFDRLFIKIRGVMREISKSKIKNKMVIIKKLMENGIFKIVFSLNPHSKFMFIVLCFLLIFVFINIVIIMSRLLTSMINIARLTKFINFFTF